MLGELELGWRLLREPLRRGHRHEREDDRDRVARPRLRGGRDAGRRRRQRRDAARFARRRLDPEATVVCECSSFQLEDSVAFAPEVAVLLNFSPDHLDRHGTLDAYLDAKLRIFASQPPAATAIWDADEPVLAGADVPGAARRVRYGVDCAAGDCAIRFADGAIRDGEGVLIERGDLALAGEHNLRNAMAVAAAALAAGVPRDARRPRARLLRRGRASPRAGRRDRRRRLRQRLQGHQRRRRPGGARLVRRAASTRSSAAASRGSGSATWSRPSPATAPPAT